MSSFWTTQELLRKQLLSHGEVVNVGEWQSIRDDRLPQSSTIELQDIHFSIPIPPTIEDLQRDIRPNLPWAEDHFLERVSGEPLNPPPSAAYWQRPGVADAHRTVEEGDEMKYSHTYPERFWPKYAGNHKVWPDTQTWGLRYRLGDLRDVVELLARNPYTRQAFLPVWFPEDTGAVHGERVPCTLGYHFLMRDKRLNVYYFIRSCDFFRHFADDVYLAARLCQWVADKMSGPHHIRDWVDPGKLIMQISSLHIFKAERSRLERSPNP